MKTPPGCSSTCSRLPLDVRTTLYFSLMTMAQSKRYFRARLQRLSTLLAISLLVVFRPKTVLSQSYFLSDTITFFTLIAGCRVYRISYICSKLSRCYRSPSEEHKLPRYAESRPGTRLRSNPDTNADFENFYMTNDSEPLPHVRPNWEQQALIVHSSGSYTEIPTSVGMFFLLIRHPCTASDGVTIGVFPPKNPPVVPMPERVLTGIIASKCTMLFCVPLLYESWVRDPAAVETLKTLTVALYAGGPITNFSGNLLADAVVPLCTLFGSKLEVAPAEGWEWIKVKFIPEVGTDAYAVSMVLELMMLKTSLLGIQQILRCSGATEDMVDVSCHDCREILMLSDAQMTKLYIALGILISPSPVHIFDPINETDLTQFRTSIRIDLTLMIIVSHPSKPFEFTLKGTPRRRAIVQTYNDDIEAAYQAAEKISQTGIALPEMWTLNGTTEWIRRVAHSIIQVDEAIADSEDLFSIGADSLVTVAIRNTIISMLCTTKAAPIASLRALTPNFVFDYPSITLLGALIHDLVASSDSMTQNDDTDEELSPVIGLTKIPEPSKKIVKLREGKGEPPLIIFHGAGGAIFEFASYTELFRTAMIILEDLVHFYSCKIKEKQPNGPYQFAGYSGSSILVFTLAKEFERGGATISQLCTLAPLIISLPSSCIPRSKLYPIVALRDTEKNVSE
ncbi:hypothetical protein DFS33DRAFT_1277546 [Desarmillaria ectypa]|nr:hypothetical protein DFS33DRAFT_1277546 [Desarmillaria ectypa]